MFFPDGTAHQIIGVKRPARVGERMWDFNVAMNFFGKVDTGRSWDQPH